MIALGSDHAGFPLKEEIRAYLDEKGVAYRDVGAYDTSSVDYPYQAKKACDLVVSGECEKAILCCGTGIGISMAANKIRGIRAACCSDAYSAEMTRRHNDANCLCMGARVVGEGLALTILDAFLGNSFEGGRHATRVGMIADIEARG